MLIAEYDYEMDMAVQREEAYEEACKTLSIQYESKLQEKDQVIHYKDMALQEKDAEIQRLKELVDAQKH